MRISDWSSDGCSSDLKYIRKAAGLGRSPTENDPDTYDYMNRHCDVLIVGAGPAGLAAALAAARSGARVILADEQEEFGGSSEERRVGQAFVRPCSSRWSPFH